jgi:hypothetical protein
MRLSVIERPSLLTLSTSGEFLSHLTVNDHAKMITFVASCPTDTEFGVIAHERITHKRCA